MNSQTIEALVTQIKAGSLSVLKLVEDCYDKIEAAQSFDFIIAETKQRALERAKTLDQEIAQGKRSNKRLFGIPFIAKDNFLSYGAKTTAASKMLANFEAPYQATAITKLEDEGAICVAKSNLDAFAHGSSTENSDFMITKNPYDVTRVPGGSSGGSAVAVALQVVPFSIGTDTGGSIRQPASFCGVIGYKPTYGLVSRSGVIAMSSSMDTIGVFTNNIDDCQLVMDVMSGQDPLDSTTLDSKHKIVYPSLPSKSSQFKVAVIKNYLDDAVDPKVRASFNVFVSKLKSDPNIVLCEIDLQSLKYALAVYYVLGPAEIASNLGRYDGLRFGYSNPSDSIEETYLSNRTNGFGAEAKRRIMIGTYVLSSGYYDAYYKKAQKVRTIIVDNFKQAFLKHDFLIGPTVPTPAFKIGQKTKHSMDMYLSDIMTVAANLAGIPDINLPIDRANNLPVGVQIMANQTQDNQLLAFSKYLEGKI